MAALPSDTDPIIRAFHMLTERVSDLEQQCERVNEHREFLEWHRGIHGPNRWTMLDHRFLGYPFPIERSSQENPGEINRLALSFDLGSWVRKTAPSIKSSWRQATSVAWQSGQDIGEEVLDKTLFAKATLGDLDFLGASSRFIVIQATSSELTRMPTMRQYVDQFIRIAKEITPPEWSLQPDEVLTIQECPSSMAKVLRLF
jgi:hypothetical protein